MNNYNKLNHTIYDCKCHLICIPKYAVSQVVGYIKGKSAIHIARTHAGRRHNFTGQNFWAWGYFVSTVGRDEETVKKYIKKLEKVARYRMGYANIINHAAVQCFYIKYSVKKFMVRAMR